MREKQQDGKIEISSPQKTWEKESGGNDLLFFGKRGREGKKGTRASNHGGGKERGKCNVIGENENCSRTPKGGEEVKRHGDKSEGLGGGGIFPCSREAREGPFRCLSGKGGILRVWAYKNKGHENVREKEKEEEDVSSQEKGGQGNTVTSKQKEKGGSR